jgi:hypothetical protein
VSDFPTPISWSAFDALRTVRRRLSDEIGCPPYLVAMDQSLKSLAVAIDGNQVARRPLEATTQGDKASLAAFIDMAQDDPFTAVVGSVLARAFFMAERETRCRATPCPAPSS